MITIMVGSDSEHREKLVEIALERSRAILQDSAAKAIVIGDTPKDVIAAHKAGVPAIGVASGSFSPDQLNEARADIVLESLAKPEEWITKVQTLKN